MMLWWYAREHPRHPSVAATQALLESAIAGAPVCLPLQRLCVDLLWNESFKWDPHVHAKEALETLIRLQSVLRW
jgi:hypothetical protein